MPSKNYNYRKERFDTIESGWDVDRIHDLMVNYSPDLEDLYNLRFSVMLYISKALYFKFTEDESTFIKRVDSSREKRDNVTPNGAVVPKKEYQLEYNMVLRSWGNIMKKLTQNDPDLLARFRMTPNIRIKFGRELEDNKGRALDTSFPHSDAWVEGPWNMNCYTPLFGDIKNNNLIFWEPKDLEIFTDDYLQTAFTYEEMQWVLEYYKNNNNLNPVKDKVHISDYALIHATTRGAGCGTRVSIDTTVCVGDHDVHPDRKDEYLDNIKIIGEEMLVSTSRTIKTESVVNTKSRFSHYTTGHLHTYNCK